MNKFFLILFLTGCTVAKDNRAVTRILSRNDLSDKVYSVLVKQHPIQIDTVYKVINGKPIVTYDTIEKPTFYTDTLIDMQPAIVKTVTHVVTKYIHTVDTLVKTVTDNRLLDAAGTRITTLETQLQASKDADSAHKKGKLHWIFASVGLFLLLLLMIILLLKKK